MPSYYFVSVLTLLLTAFINKPDSWSALTIFMISFLSSFEIINVVCIPKIEVHITDANTFSRIAASIAYAAVVNPHGIKTNIFIKNIFSLGAKSQPKIPPDCTNLCNLAFDSLY